MMIPYIMQPVLKVGPVTIAAFGAIVAASVMVGLAIGERRFRKLGLDRVLGERLAWWVIVSGFLGAHLFSVLFYFPREVAANPLILLQFWKDISSFGSMVGGLVGIWLFFRLRGSRLSSLQRWAYLDVVAFVFPISLMIGRVACSLAHDHPGTITTFPLAISLRTAAAQAYITDVYGEAGRLSELPSSLGLSRMGFHDLGWYELLFLATVVVPLLVHLDKKPRPPGFFLLMFTILYMPIRFLFDFLRVVDERYAGLTPGQWLALTALAGVPILTRRIRKNLAEQSVPAHSPFPGSTDISPSVTDPSSGMLS